MKTKLSLLLIIAVALVGCGKTETKPVAKQTKTNATSDIGNPVQAPANYLGGLAAAKKLAEKTVDTAALNQAVQLFNAQEGRFPKDLGELVTQAYIRRMPEAPYGMKITYDNKTGQVKVVKE